MNKNPLANASAEEIARASRFVDQHASLVEAIIEPEIEALTKQLDQLKAERDMIMKDMGDAVEQTKADVAAVIKAMKDQFAQDLRDIQDQVKRDTDAREDAAMAEVKAIFGE